MSLFHPPAWFPPQLAFLWPLIWVQVLMLRAQIRVAYGRGVVYRWSVTDNLRVYLVRIEWMPGQKREHAILNSTAYSSDRLAAACDGRAAMPTYLRTLSLSLGRGVGVRGDALSAHTILAETSRPLIPTPFSQGRRGSRLPLPET